MITFLRLPAVVFILPVLSAAAHSQGLSETAFPKFNILLQRPRAFADKEIRGAASPNGRYSVWAVARNSPSKNFYEIVTSRDRSVLHRFPSSFRYHDVESWWKTASAEVSWSPDSRYVAINEDHHDFPGSFFLAEIGKTIRAIPFPEKSLLEQTQLRWDHYQIRMEDDWSSDQSLPLTLEMIGVRRKRRPHDQVTFHFTLHISHGKANVSLVKRDEDE